MFYGRLLVLIFSLVVPAIFDPIAYLYLFSQQINMQDPGLSVPLCLVDLSIVACVTLRGHISNS